MSKKITTKIILLILITVFALISTYSYLIYIKNQETSELAINQFKFVDSDSISNDTNSQLPVNKSNPYKLIKSEINFTSLLKQDYLMVRYREPLENTERVNIYYISIYRHNIFESWNIDYPSYAINLRGYSYETILESASKKSLKDFENMENATVRKLTSPDDVQAESKNSMDNKLTPQQIQQLQGTAARTTQ